MTYQPNNLNIYSDTLLNNISLITSTNNFLAGKEQSNVFEKDCDVILWDTNAAGFLLFAMVSNSNISIKSREVYGAVVLCSFPNI